MGTAATTGPSKLETAGAIAADLPGAYAQHLGATGLTFSTTMC